MESKIKQHKLVPETNGCEGCAFFKMFKPCPIDYGFLDCFDKHAIYVPADTAIEVPKENQQNDGKTQSKR